MTFTQKVSTCQQSPEQRGAKKNLGKDDDSGAKGGREGEAGECSGRGDSGPTHHGLGAGVGTGSRLSVHGGNFTAPVLTFTKVFNEAGRDCQTDR